ncbi:MAG: CDP-alcohol phosphatidyltransferase family protein [Deltaproteobacteria bacterium]|nr:CDP-alcohol phosphatidyltransferase family protein [Deltaproteobacteria bacterium]
MMETAVIVVSGGGVSPLTQFGGLSLLKRAVLTAQKAGATTCYLVTPPDQQGLQPELQNDPRVTSRVVWGHLPPGIMPAVEPENSCLVFATDTVFRHPLALELSQQAAPGRTLAATDVDGVPVLALTDGSRIPSMCAELAQGKSLPETTVLAQSEKVQAGSIGNHFVYRLTRGSHLAGVEQALLLSLENPRDGQVDAHFNRKLSRPLTRWLVRTPLSPNQITVLACAVGLLGALCFVPGGYWGPVLGALLLQFAVVLDCCDGEVARVKFMESPLGDWLDIVCDTVVSIAIFLGLGVAVWRNGAVNHALVLAGVLVLGGVLAFPLVTLAEKTEELGNRRNGWEDGLIKKLLASLTTRDFSVLIVASAVTGQLGWFLWGAAIGAQVFCLFLAWLLFRAGRFAWVRRDWERKGI